MAYKINQECSSCGACEPECPNGAISEGGDIYIIDPVKCTECVGFFDVPQCADVCPVDACVPDPDRKEDENTLIQRAKTLHPDKKFGSTFPSRFKS